MESNGTKYYQIGELANSLELSPLTRYDKEMGLLDSFKRIEGARRVYTDKDLQHSKFV